MQRHSAPYDKGQGVKQDEKEAVAWYRLAAKQGHAGAQYNLGAMCENVQGVLQNFAEALQWFQSAAEQGDENALKASVRVLKKINCMFAFVFTVTMV